MQKLVLVLEVFSFLTLVGLVAYAIGTGALKDNWLAIVLIVIAALSPSPYRILLKIKDWIEVRRNGVRTQNHHSPQSHQTHQIPAEQASPLQEEVEGQDGQHHNSPSPQSLTFP